MIDSHCHLEQKDYDKDRDTVIEKCKKTGLKAIITSCAHPRDFDKTLEIVKRYSGFVFATVGIHPEYIKEFSEAEIDNYIEKIKKNSDKIVGIGEIGLDYFWVKDPEWQEKQKELFVKMIRLAKELKKPIVIHSRDALEKTLDILESEDADKVVLHMWGGHALMDRVIKDKYYVSMNSIVMRSKSYRNVVKRVPLEQLMLETDAPWLALKKAEDGYEIDVNSRNDSTTIKLVAEKIAELKSVDFEEVWKKCAENSIKFFSLPIKL